jgi:hypothetical protein
MKDVAFRIELINSCAENGFCKKAAQPASMASLRTSIVSSAVMKITGVVDSIAFNRRCISIPDMPPIFMSRTVHVTSLALPRSRNASAELKTSAVKSDASDTRLSPLKTLGSSSTIATRRFVDKLPSLGREPEPHLIVFRPETRLMILSLGAILIRPDCNTTETRKRYWRGRAFADDLLVQLSFESMLRPFERPANHLKSLNTVGFPVRRGRSCCNIWCVLNIVESDGFASDCN